MFLWNQDRPQKKDENDKYLHPTLPFFGLMPVQVQYRFPCECRLVLMDFKGSHSCYNNEKKVEEKEQISAVILQMQHTNKKGY